MLCFCTLLVKEYAMQLCGAIKACIFRCVASVAHLFILRGVKLMKLMIAGSRSITEFDLAPHVPDGVHTIITGGAPGIDTIAEQFADKKKISKFIIRPRYDLYGKYAPIKRNCEMVDMADIVFVIWDGISKGSLSTINYAKKVGKKLILIQI